MNYKIAPIAAAILAAVASSNAAAADPVKDGWSVNGYGMMNYRLVDMASVDTEFGKPDYRTAGTFAKSANQVEFTVKKNTQYESGVYSDYVVRAEYGNGDSYYYSSSGGEHDGGKGQFEVKEAYVLIGNLPYLPSNSQVWAGRRFLNRSSGLLSGEFWKQSSGVGAGYEKGFDNGTRGGVALVSADPDKTAESGSRPTLTSLDFYYYGTKALGGSLDFDLKLMKQAHTQDVDGQSTDTGIGGAITYNRDYYGFEGWSQTAIGYGQGLATNRGVNFGQWSSGGFDKDSQALFFTTYGVANVTDKLQFGSEITYWGPHNVNWTGTSADIDVDRLLVAVRPSYKINNNLRFEVTGAVAQENLSDGALWGRSGDNATFYSVEVAPVLTVNADFFGRPQIKPYVALVKASKNELGSAIGTTGEDVQTIFGVQGEIWF